jgi:N-carbamoylputrescine amidase
MFSTPTASIASIVAAVQFNPELLNVNRNLSTALQLTFEAAAKGAKIIVLPELCTSGYVLRNQREAMLCAQDRHGYQTEAFTTITQRFGCHVVFGYVELLEGNLYNSAAVVGPRGLEANAQKHNLWGSDNLWAQPSESLAPVVLTPVGRLGVLICRDAANKYRESYQFNHDQKFYQRGSIDTIALLTNWGESYGYPDSSWVELVEETRANLIVSNRVGEERDMKFKGGSCCIDRNRRIWTNGSSFTEPAVVGGIVVT